MGTCTQRSAHGSTAKRGRSCVKKKHGPLPPDDDGRTIADMNVEGMPWYVNKEQRGDDEPLQLTREQSRAVIGGVLKAALLIAAVFGGVYLLFLLFCDLVWFA